ncbi:hypothetical protein ABZ705_27970 [Streptomyces sp. NPDC006984]|uniref:hypothetical protein n=1 Tax=Streptomyces sp. NPDC006984 TaxID=3155463 RepID=UPI0033FCC936
MAAARQTQGAALSPECAVAARPGYEDLHGQCRRTGDVPLPHATGLLLVHRCTCPCHGRDRERPQPSQERAPQGTRTARPAPERTADGTGAPRNISSTLRRSRP